MRFARPIRPFSKGPAQAVVALVVALAVLAAGWLGRKSTDAVATQADPVGQPPAAAPDGLAGGPASVHLLADADYLPRLLALLRKAHSSIEITLFSCVLPDDARADHPVRQLLETLVERAGAGVQVRVVLDHGVPPSRRRPGEEAPSDNAARWLAARGIAVRWDEDDRTTHTKSLVVDGRWCIVGSTNWTFSALRRNREQSLLLDDPALAATLTTQFNALWKRATPVLSPAQR